MRQETNLTDACIAARREYQKEWRRKNKHRIQIYNQKFWSKRVEKKLREAAQGND